MKKLFDKIECNSLNKPHQTALISGNDRVSNAQLKKSVNELSDELKLSGMHCLGLYMDNCIDWIIIDLAALKANITLIPIPLFFTQEQIQHLSVDAGIQAIVTSAATASPIEAQEKSSLLHSECVLHLLNTPGNKLPQNIAKITYTSGSTGQPKGVCLSNENLQNVVVGIVESMQPMQLGAHLCVMPLATLLENIAGVYVPLLRGGSVIIEPLQQLGFQSNSQFDIAMLNSVIQQHQPDSIILLPHILKLAVGYKSLHENSFSGLEFIAVGGGKTSPATIKQSIELKMPVYEGYGLSECASVVSLNLLGNNRIGSVGKVLPHTQVHIAEDGEIIIRGQAMLGYLNQLDQAEDKTHTGDYGHIDDDGYIYVSGRKKNVIVSSFGRNISPEWVESELLSCSEISQVAVFGDARECLCAVITAPAGVNTQNIKDAVTRSNSKLPDYAQAVHLLIVTEAFTSANNMLTQNGRIKREAIALHYRQEIAELYQSDAA